MDRDPPPSNEGAEGAAGPHDDTVPLSPDFHDAHTDTSDDQPQRQDQPDHQNNPLLDDQGYVRLLNPPIIPRRNIPNQRVPTPSSEGSSIMSDNEGATYVINKTNNTIPEFSGENLEVASAESWVETVDHMRIGSEWSDEATAGHAYVKLKGPARKWARYLRRFPPRDQPQATELWSSFRLHILQQWGQVSRPKKAVECLRSLQQVGATNTVDFLAAEVANTVLDIYESRQLLHTPNLSPETFAYG